MFKGREKAASKNKKAEFKNLGTAQLGILVETVQGGEKSLMNQANMIICILSLGKKIVTNCSPNFKTQFRV